MSCLTSSISGQNLKKRFKDPQSLVDEIEATFSKPSKAWSKPLQNSFNHLSRQKQQPKVPVPAFKTPILAHMTTTDSLFSPVNLMNNPREKVQFKPATAFQTPKLAYSEPVKKQKMENQSAKVVTNPQKQPKKKTSSSKSKKGDIRNELIIKNFKEFDKFVFTTRKEAKMKKSNRGRKKNSGKSQRLEIIDQVYKEIVRLEEPLVMRDNTFEELANSALHKIEFNPTEQTQGVGSENRIIVKKEELSESNNVQRSAAKPLVKEEQHVDPMIQTKRELDSTNNQIARVKKES